MRKIRLSYLCFALLVAGAMMLTACAPAATPAPTAAPAQPTAAPAQPTAAPAQPTAAPTTPPPTTVPTIAPTVAPTIPPAACAPLASQPAVKAGDLGSPDKPIEMTFVPSGDTGKIATAGNAIADCLGKITGLKFNINVGTSYAASIEAMGAGKAQVGFLNTFSAVAAGAKYGVVPILAVVRNYSTNDVDPDKNLAGQKEPFYKAEFLANVNSGIKGFSDLKGKTFCFVEPSSTSGYIIPRMILKSKGIDPDKDFASTQNAGSHNNVAIAVYKGDCDAGVAYVDIRTDKTANLKATYPDIMQKVTVFADSDRIPNDGVQVVKDFPPAYTKALVDAMTAMSADPGGIAMLKSLYAATAYVPIDASFYTAFTTLCNAAGPDLCPLPK